MASSEHLEILAKGKETWNKWRRDNPDIAPDLSHAKFENFKDIQWDFSGFNLSRANLTEAEFYGCSFIESDLSEILFVNVVAQFCQFVDTDFSRSLVAKFDASETTMKVRADFTRVKFSGTRFANAYFRMSGFNDIDFRNMNFRGCDFKESSFRDCDLRNTDWTNASLRDSGFQNCNLEAAKFINVYFDRSGFEHSYLKDVSLVQSTFSMMHLEGFDFSNLDLSYCSFGHYCKLGKVIFQNTNLYGARFTELSLKAVDFTDANLSNAEFVDTDLDEANLQNVVLSQTLLAGVNLSKALGLETCQHIGPSKVDIRTLELSGALPLEFLRGVGLSDTLITYHQSLFLEEPIQFYSCFISFTEADDDLAQRLYNDLQGEGVRCWRWKEDAKWGRSMIGEIDTAVRNYDKLVVICSEHSLKSNPVIREIERAFQKEDRLKAEGHDIHVLFPILIDDYIFQWEHPRKADVMAKVIGHFKNWKNQDDYTQLFERLLAYLKPD